MIVSVHQPQYLPWIGYFDKIDKSDCFVFLDTVQYKPREFQNRNKICVKGGWLWLTVPVNVKGHYKQSILDVEIDNEKAWNAKHKKNLISWYGNTQFFNTYFPFFEEVYNKKCNKLVDLNVMIIKYLLEKLKTDRPVYFESEIGTTKMGTDRIIEICQKLRANTYLSGIGGKDYLEEEKFLKAGITLKYQEFNHPNYRQHYESQTQSFQPYMSVIDLLFNEGTRSIDIIREAQGRGIPG